MKHPKPAFVNYPPVAGWNRLPENMALVRVIRRRRLRLGLSQNQLANLTCLPGTGPQVSRPTISNFESDKFLLGPDALGHVARALGTTIADLYFEAQEWIARLPACCHACKYACMALGELKRLTVDRQCSRHVIVSPTLAAGPDSLA